MRSIQRSSRCFTRPACCPIQRVCRAYKYHGRCHHERLPAIAVGQASGCRHSGQTTQYGAAHYPALHGGHVFYAEIGFVEGFGTARHHPVVSEQQPSHGRYQGDEQHIHLVSSDCDIHDFPVFFPHKVRAMPQYEKCKDCSKTCIMLLYLSIEIFSYWQ